MLKELRKKYDKARGAKDYIENEIEQLETELEQYEKRHLAIVSAQAFIQKVAVDTQNQVCIEIEDIVNSCVDVLFPGVYKFIMQFTPKRGKTEVEFYLDKEGTLLHPRDDVGGGVADVVGFALRLAVWRLSGTDNTIVLDEPMKFLSKGLRPQMSEFLDVISEKLGLQIIMVTHDEEFVNCADRVFRIQQKKRKSIVTVERE